MRPSVSTQVLRAVREPLAVLAITVVLMQALLGSLSAAAMAGALADPLGPHSVRCLPFVETDNRSVPAGDDAPSVPSCCSAVCGMVCASGAAVAGTDTTLPGPLIEAASLAPDRSAAVARVSGDRRLAEARAPPRRA